MTEHLTEQQMERFLYQQDSLTERAEMERHLRACSECDAQMRAARALIDAYRNVRAGAYGEDAALEHPPSELIAAYVEGTLKVSEAEAIEAHLQLCSACQEEVDQLRLFAEEIADQPAPTVSETAMAPLVSAPTGPVSTGERPGPVETPRAEAGPATQPGEGQGNVIDFPARASQQKGWWSRLTQSPGFRFTMQSAVPALAAASLVGVIVWKQQDTLHQTQQQIHAEVSQIAHQVDGLHETQKTILAQNSSATDQIKQAHGEIAQIDERIRHLKTNTIVPVPTPTGSTTLIAKDTGGTVVQTKQGQLRFETALPDIVGKTLATQSWPIPREVAALHPSLVAQRSWNSRSARPLSPVGTRVIETAPTLTWSGSTRASYWITVYKGKDVIRPPHRTVLTSWKVDPPLEAGQTYTWSVVLAGPGSSATNAIVPEEARSTFSILSDAERQTLEAKVAQYSGSHLTLAVLYAQAGLLDKADEELRLLGANPANSALVTQLRGRLQSQRNSPPR